MTWNLQRGNRSKKFRNPLVAVVFQLRFHPILQVDNKIPEFQNEVRARFPGYAQELRQMFRVNAPMPIEIEAAANHRFIKEDGSSTLSLSVDSFAVEQRVYSGHNNFLDDVRLGLDTFSSLHGNAGTTRLGLRYVNHIDKTKISEDLSRELGWEDLISSDFLHPANHLVGLEGSKFLCELHAPVKDRKGALALRYGLESTSQGADSKFRIDFDRFLVGPVDLDQVIPLLDGFGKDLNALFDEISGEALREWMTKPELEEQIK